MTDPIAVSAAVALFNSVLNAFKQVRELSTDSGDLNLKGSISELYDKLLDVREKLLDLDDENRRLRQQLEIKAKVERKKPFGYYYLEGEIDSPLCRVCYERDGRLIHLDHPLHDGDGAIRRWCCGCQQSFYEQLPAKSSSQQEYDPYL